MDISILLKYGIGSGLGLELSQAKPNQVKASQAKPGQAKLSQAGSRVNTREWGFEWGA